MEYRIKTISVENYLTKTLLETQRNLSHLLKAGLNPYAFKKNDFPVRNAISGLQAIDINKEVLTVSAALYGIKRNIFVGIADAQNIGLTINTKESAIPYFVKDSEGKVHVNLINFTEQFDSKSEKNVFNSFKKTKSTDMITEAKLNSACQNFIVNVINYDTQLQDRKKQREIRQNIKYNFSPNNPLSSSIKSLPEKLTSTRDQLIAFKAIRNYYINQAAGKKIIDDSNSESVIITSIKKTITDGSFFPNAFNAMIASEQCKHENGKLPQYEKFTMPGKAVNLEKTESKAPRHNQKVKGEPERQRSIIRDRRRTR